MSNPSVILSHQYYPQTMVTRFVLTFKKPDAPHVYFELDLTDEFLFSKYKSDTEVLLIVHSCFIKRVLGSDLPENEKEFVLNKLSDVIETDAPNKHEYYAADYSLLDIVPDNAYNNAPSISTASRKLPGMDVKVKCPHHVEPEDAMLCVRGHQTLWSVIQHLNDGCNWSRERIADWIDKLHDEGIINAEF